MGKSKATPKIVIKRIILVLILLFFIFEIYNYNIRLIPYSEASSSDNTNQVSVYRVGKEFLDHDSDVKIYLNGNRIVEFNIKKDPQENFRCQIKWINDKNFIVIFYDSVPFLVNIKIESEKASIHYYDVRKKGIATDYFNVSESDKYRPTYDHKIKINEKYAYIDQEKMDALQLYEMK